MIDKKGNVEMKLMPYSKLKQAKLDNLNTRL